MKVDTTIWQQRPIPPQLLRYAAEDVSQLLALADKLTSELGSAALSLVPQLSKANAQWFWDLADRDGPESSSSFRSIVEPGSVVLCLNVCSCFV